MLYDDKGMYGSYSKVGRDNIIANDTRDSVMHKRDTSVPVEMSPPCHSNRTKQPLPEVYPTSVNQTPLPPRPLDIQPPSQLQGTMTPPNNAGTINPSHTFEDNFGLPPASSSPRSVSDKGQSGAQELTSKKNLFPEFVSSRPIRIKKERCFYDANEGVSKPRDSGNDIDAL